MSSQPNDVLQREIEMETLSLGERNNRMTSNDKSAMEPPPSPSKLERHSGSKESSSSTKSAPSSSNAKVIFAVTLQSFCSVSMVLTNKALASSYNHFITHGDLNIFLVVVQAIVAVACVEFCKLLKWVEYPSFEWSTARKWAPVNLIFCGMLFTGMASLQHNSVPMVTVFKNITNILISAGDYHFFGTPIETLVVVAFAVMLGGACLAAMNDVEVTFIGLFWMAANCITTAAYVLYMKFATNTVKLPKFGMVFYNNVLCTLFLFPAAFVRGDIKTFWETPAIHTWDYALTNFFAGFVGFFLNFSSLNCISVTGPTTYAIVGSVNKIPIAIIGYLLFDSVISSETWFFIGISMLGGFLYSYAKIKSSSSLPSSLNKEGATIAKSESNDETQTEHHDDYKGDEELALLDGKMSKNDGRNATTAKLRG